MCVVGTSAVRRLSAAIAAALFCAAPAPGEDEEVRVCPSCGVEASGPEAAFCASCGAPLGGPSAPAAAAEAPEPEPPAGSSASQDAGILAGAAGAVAAVAAADAAAARNSRDPAVRFAACRDTLRAAAFFPGTVQESVAAALASAKAEALAALSAPQRERCPECGGSGVSAAAKKAETPKKSGSSRPARRIEDSAVGFSDKAAGPPCGFCGGAGALPRVRDRAAVLDSLRLGAAAFAREAEAKGRAEASGVWWPQGFAAAMRSPEAAGTVRALRGAAPEDCGTCAGLGTVRCQACKGWGRTRGKSGGAERCRGCSGRGFAACRACGGMGHGRQR